MRYLIPILVVIVLTACGGPSTTAIEATVQAAVQATLTASAEAEVANTCSDADMVAYADQIERKMDRFIQQAELTGSTPRASMGEPLQRLLDVQNETEDIEAPDCLAQYHRHVIGAMVLYRTGYQTFAAQGDENLVTASLQVGEESMEEARAGLADIREGQIPAGLENEEPTSEPSETSAAGA